MDSYLGGDEHRLATQQGSRAANQMRKQFLYQLSTGSVTFRRVVTLSREYEYRALGKLKLSAILSSQPGWSTNTSTEALLSGGFGAKDNIEGIRKSESKIDAFGKLIGITPDQFRARPEFPQGWPWFGRLEDLLNPENETYLPDELARMSPDYSSDDDELDNLLMGEDGDDEEDVINDLLGGD